jgi:hypothetical protein
MRVGDKVERRVEIPKQIRALFSWRKIWGWAVTVFGLVTQAIHWGWFSLDVFGRLDVAWRVVETMGGTAALAATVLSSWQFSLCLIVVGLSYLIFVGEPEAGVKRHPALPYLAASILFICIAAMGSIAIYGWYELQLRTAYAEGASGIPRNSSPSNPKTLGNQRPLVSDAPRNLAPDQQRILITEGGRMHEDLGTFMLAFLSTDSDTRAYANEFQGALARAAINAAFNAQPNLGDPNDEGLIIQVADKNNPPPQALKLRELLALADIQVRFGNGKFFNTQAYPVVLFVGPRPLQR